MSEISDQESEELNPCNLWLKLGRFLQEIAEDAEGRKKRAAGEGRLK